MKIVFVSNFFNHHQKPVSDEFYRVCNGDYRFIETTPITPWRRKMGYKEIEVPYTIKLEDNTRSIVIDLINNADVVITDAEYLDLTKERYESGGLMFRYSERLFKSRSRYLKAPIHAFKAWKTRNMYLLCSSGFTARDYNLMGFFKGRSYKWGYFPVRTLQNDIHSLIDNKKKNSILWVGRLIDWKHPESLVYVANGLKRDGFDYVINIIGVGEMKEKLQQQVKKDGLADNVHFLGGMSPNEVREHMMESEIFLFTSDEGEGWGAVLNEAMNSGCAVVASDKIGSVPYLLSEKENGYSFQSKNWNDLYSKVRLLLENDEDRKRMAHNALSTIQETWNEEVAVRNFITLSNSILSGTIQNIKEGPCSPA